MSGIYVAVIGTVDAGTRHIVFKLLDGESPERTAQAFADDFETPLMRVCPVEDFINDDLFELVTV